MPQACEQQLFCIAAVRELVCSACTMCWQGAHLEAEQQEHVGRTCTGFWQGAHLEAEQQEHVGRTCTGFWQGAHLEAEQHEHVGRVCTGLRQVPTLRLTSRNMSAAPAQGSGRAPALRLSSRNKSAAPAQGTGRAPTLRLNSRNMSAAKSNSSALSASSQPQAFAAGCGDAPGSHAAPLNVRSGTAHSRMESVYTKRSTTSKAPALMPPMAASGSGRPCPDPTPDRSGAAPHGLPRASERSSSARKYSERAARMHWWHLSVCKRCLSAHIQKLERKIHYQAGPYSSPCDTSNNWSAIASKQ